MLFHFIISSLRDCIFPPDVTVSIFSWVLISMLAVEASGANSPMAGIKVGLGSNLSAATRGSWLAWALLTPDHMFDLGEEDLGTSILQRKKLFTEMRVAKP